mmetsp:Transcript_6529/g.14371  ORF Transcript_6529/g.14371 Transcript_6529/m.14371 type:complete len:127 (+) Transcript_6529:158-538(+)
MSGNNPDYEPPMACVSRVMKQSLPDNVLLTKDARAAFVRAAGIFIFYLTHCANDFCRESGRTTIFPQDIMAALKYEAVCLLYPHYRSYLPPSLSLLFPHFSELLHLPFLSLTSFLPLYLSSFLSLI